MSRTTVRPVEEADGPWLLRFLRERWGSERMVANGEVFYPGEHQGFLALLDDEPVGVVTYRVDSEACEITLIDSAMQHQGIGTLLIEAAEKAAGEAGCSRVWLVTTNDNLNALRFYQRRGYVLAALRPNALQASRQLKPEIPEIGEMGIPLRDELELEKYLR